jgi:hypothetical protein
MLPLCFDGRGNGTSLALGSVTHFTAKPVLAINKLATRKDKWEADTTGTGFFTKGYVLDSQERPAFKYYIYGNTGYRRCEGNGKRARA